MHALGRAAVVLAGLSACALGGTIPAHGALAAGHPAGGQTVRPDRASLAIFRVDVSRYPQVGLVVESGEPRLVLGNPVHESTKKLLGEWNEQA